MPDRPLAATAPELEISREKVCALIFELRAHLGKIRRSGTQDAPVQEDQPQAGAQELPGDATREQAQELLRGLNHGEKKNLLALMWLGRGDYEIAEWAAALAEADDQLASGDSDLDLDDMATPEHLEAGLEHFGGACGEP